MDIKTIEAGPKKQVLDNPNLQLGLNLQEIGLRGLEKNAAVAIQNYANEKDIQNRINNNNLFTEVSMQSFDIIENYKKNNALDPNNEDNYNKLISSLENVGTKALLKVDSKYKGSFKLALNENLNKNKLELEGWKYTQNNKNNLQQIGNQINTLNNQAVAYGRVNKLDDALKFYSIQEGNIKNKARLMFGEEKANELTNNLQKDYVTSYINGLIQNNPEEVLNVLDTKEQNPIKNIIGEKASDDFIKASRAKIKDIQDYKITRESADLLRKESEITTQALEGNLDYITLNNFIEENNVSNATKNFLYRRAGFSTSGNGGSGIGGKTEKRTAEEKMNANAFINEKLIELRGNIENVNMDNIKKIKNMIFEKAEQGLINDNELKNYLQDLSYYTSEFLEYDSKENYQAKRFIFRDQSANDLHDFIRDTSVQFGILDADMSEEEQEKKLTKLSGADRNYVASMKNFLYSTYRDNVDKAIIDYAFQQQNIVSNDKKQIIYNQDGSVNQVQTINVFKKTMPQKDYSKITNKAKKQTIKDYAEKIGIDTKDKSYNEMVEGIANDVDKHLQNRFDKLIDITADKIITNDYGTFLNYLKNVR